MPDPNARATTARRRGGSEVHADRRGVHDDGRGRRDSGHACEEERLPCQGLIAQAQRAEQQRRHRQLRHEPLEVIAELQVAARGAGSADSREGRRGELAPDQPIRRERGKRHHDGEHWVEGRERIAREREHRCQQRVGALWIPARECLDDGVRRATGKRRTVGHRQRTGVGDVDDRVVAGVPAEHSRLVAAIGRGEDRERDACAEQRPERQASGVRVAPAAPLRRATTGPPSPRSAPGRECRAARRRRHRSRRRRTRTGTERARVASSCVRRHAATPAASTSVGTPRIAMA